MDRCVYCSGLLSGPPGSVCRNCHRLLLPFQVFPSRLIPNSIGEPRRVTEAAPLDPFITVCDSLRALPLRVAEDFLVRTYRVLPVVACSLVRSDPGYDLLAFLKGYPDEIDSLKSLLAEGPSAASISIWEHLEE